MDSYTWSSILPVNLLTADDQIRCFQNAARHLTPDGRFVVEAALPHA